jgi:hypothetical protein
VVSFTPRSLYLRGKSPQYPLDRRLGEPQSRCAGLGRRDKSLPLQVIKTWFFGRPARSLITIPTELSWLRAIKHNTIKTLSTMPWWHMGKRRCSSTILEPALDRGEWSAPSTSCFIPEDRWLGGPYSRFSRCEEEINPCHCRKSKPDSSVVQAAARFLYWQSYPGST